MMARGSDCRSIFLDPLCPRFLVSSSTCCPKTAHQSVVTPSSLATFLLIHDSSPREHPNQLSVTERDDLRTTETSTLGPGLRHPTTPDLKTPVGPLRTRPSRTTEIQSAAATWTIATTSYPALSVPRGLQGRNQQQGPVQLPQVWGLWPPVVWGYLGLQWTY